LCKEKSKDADSAGFRTNEALRQLSYEFAPYLKEVVKHMCSGNLGIVKILELHHISKHPS
jgi:hypothetical protein